MKWTALASGSKGNSAVLDSGTTRILVDAGLSCRELFRRMREMGEQPERLDAIVITHEHVDHVNGLGATARKLGIPVYITEPTHRAWVRMMTPRTTMSYKQWIALQQEKAAHAGAGEVSAGDEVLEAAPVSEGMLKAMAEDEEDAAPADKAASNAAELGVVEYFTAGTAFTIGDIHLAPFTIPHDAVDPVGFVFEAAGVRIGLATDLGYVPPNVKLALKRCQLLVLESNHDLEMLRDGPYPWQVKQRVLSRVGHLSNDAAAEFLTVDYDGGAEYVILAHLSESNNLPELARLAAEKALSERGTLLGNRLLLAEQGQALKTICL